jgi:hypothetical protein
MNGKDEKRVPVLLKIQFERFFKKHPVADFCEHGNKYFGSIKAGNFLVG